jgi:hypothetical protein
MKKKNSISLKSANLKIFVIIVTLLISIPIAFSDLYLNSKTGYINLNTTGETRLQITPGGNVNLLGLANVSILGNLSVGGNVSVDGGTLFVNSIDNKVGIGTTSPDQLLDVVGINTSIKIDTTTWAAASNLSLMFRNRDSVITKEYDDGMIFDDNNQFIFREAGTELMRMQSGNVGIGTASPTQKLEVIGNISINDSVSDGNILIDSTNNAILFTGENGSLYQPVYGTDDDLVLYLPFNAPNGTTQFDRSPYGNDATLEGGINCNATLGRFGAACFFDNNTNDYIDLVDDTASNDLTGAFSFADIDAFTLELWYKGTDDVQNGDFGKALIGRNNGDLYAQFALRSGFAEYIHYDGAWSHNIKSTTFVADDKWHHIAYVNSNGTGDLFIDGMQEIDGESSLIDAGRYFTGSAIMRGYLDSYTNGTIDEVRIYKRALAPEEIRTHYLRGSGFGASGAITANKFRIVNTSGNVNLIVNNDGNVGIGTASPLAQFLTLGDPALSLTTPFDLLISSDAPQIGFEETGVTTDNKLWDFIFNSEQFLFRIINDAESVAGTIMQVDRTGTTVDTVAFPNGNVGIGTASPGKLLHISSSSSTARAGINISEDNARNLIIESPGSSATDDASLPSGQALNHYIYSDIGDLRIGSRDSDVEFFTGTGVDIHIESDNGNVGIGTSIPAMKLQVEGSIKLVAGQPELRFNETDVGASPAGIWRAVVGGDAFYIQRNTAAAADFSTSTNGLQISSGGNVVMVGSCSGASSACNSDIAEAISVKESEELEPGDVLVISSDNEEFVTKSTKKYDVKIAGIFTSRPGMYMSSSEGIKLGGWDFTNLTGTKHNGTIPMALAGQVVTKVTNESGAIKKGDLLTTSSTPGHAMKFTLISPETAVDFGDLKRILEVNEQRRNSILGKALESFVGEKGKIIALITLQ